MTVNTRLHLCCMASTSDNEWLVNGWFKQHFVRPGKHFPGQSLPYMGATRNLEGNQRVVSRRFWSFGCSAMVKGGFGKCAQKPYRNKAHIWPPRKRAGTATFQPPVLSPLSTNDMYTALRPRCVPVKGLFVFTLSVFHDRFRSYLQNLLPIFAGM